MVGREKKGLVLMRKTTLVSIVLLGLLCVAAILLMPITSKGSFHGAITSVRSAIKLYQDKHDRLPQAKSDILPYLSQVTAAKLSGMRLLETNNSQAEYELVFEEKSWLRNVMVRRIVITEVE